MNENEYGFNSEENKTPEYRSADSTEKTVSEENKTEEPAYQSTYQVKPDTDASANKGPEPPIFNRNQYDYYHNQANYAGRVRPEPAYSPYADKTSAAGNQYAQRQAQPQQSQSYYGGYSAPKPNVSAQTNPIDDDIYSVDDEEKNTGKNKKTKKNKKGFAGFLIALVAVVVCTGILLATLKFPEIKDSIGKDKKNDTETSESSGDDTQLQIADNSALSEKSKSSAAIAEAAQKFNVGILIYGKAQAFGSAGNSLVGEGSGIIMGEDSAKKYTYIITCAHVINEAKAAGYEMTVQDCKGNTYDGIFVGSDPKTDVGVIKIEKTGLTAATFGDSSSLVIGQQVYAIGNPGGTEFFGSFTNGMISAIDRPISSESGYEMKCIQHTTPINSGNSGGALLNEAGQVIGINSSKIVSTGYEGMAFSIPITDAKPIIDDIIAHGYVTNRPKLGISYAAATNYREYSMIVALKDLPAGSLIIASISKDSALAKTDAKVGDMIIAVDGEDLTTADVLLEKIESGKVGDSLKLTLCRVNNDYSIKTFTVDVKLVEDDGTGAITEQTTTNYFDQFGY